MHVGQTTGFYMIDIFLQQIANGLSIGMSYALVAAGLALIFGIMGVINFAHGEFYVLGAYGLIIAMGQLGLDYFTGALLAVALVSVLALVVQIVIIEPVMRTHHLNSLLATFGLSIFIHYLLVLFLGSSGRLIRSPFNFVVELGPVVMSGHRVFVLCAGAVVLLGLGLFLKLLPLGRLMRATAQNRFAAASVGVNVRLIERVTFVVGIALAAIGGILLGPLTPVVPTVGATLTLKAFAVIVLGGLSSVPGAIVAGLLLGTIETLAAGYLSSAWKDAVAFSVLILVLLIRPSGMFGKATS